MSARRWILDVAALDAADAAATLRFASAAYTDGSANYYDLRLQQPGLYTVKGFGAVLPGSARSGVGEAVLLNTDGGLDYLADYSVDGRLATLKLVDEADVVTQVLRGTVESLSYSGTRVALRLRDPYASLNRPHPYNVYGGTNALPAGADGVATDIKGKRRPRSYGKVRNAAPMLVNTSRYIYEVSDLTTATVSAVYDRGVALTNGGAYSDMATLQSTPPSAGQFRAFQGYFRVGTTPSGTVTCDVDDSTSLLGAVASKLVVEAGYTMDSGDVTAMNAIGDCTIYLTDTRSTAAMLDLLANSAGGYWSLDSAGVVRMRQLLAPVSPTLALYDYNIIKLTRRATGAGSNGLPVYRVKMQADRVEETQDDLAASVPTDRVARMAQEYREAVAETAAVLTRHPLAPDLVLETALRNLADAQTQATRLGALLAVRRDLVACEARLDTDTAASIAIGTVLTLTSTKLGYSAGRVMVVVGYTLDARLSRVILDLWG